MDICTKLAIFVLFYNLAIASYYTMKFHYYAKKLDKKYKEFCR